MASEPRTEAKPAAPDNATGRALFDRVKASQDLSRSPRLRQLFEYLCARSFEDPQVPLSEERIGVEVFGRLPGYDTAVDTIVRVQVSQLRKKLERYFLAEGAAEPVIIDLPKRAYIPVFRAREQVLLENEPSAPVRTPRNWRAISLGLATLLLVCLIFAGWLALENSSLPASALIGRGRMPFRDHFWSQLFRGGRQTQLVTSDANVMELCDFLGRTITPAEYIGSGYPNALIDSGLPDPSTRRVLRSISSNFVTNMPDVRVSNQLSLIAAGLGGRLNILFARDFRYQPQTPDNLIFLSHRKANPWVSLFEQRLNFQYEFEAKENRAAILNLAPKPGEERKYPVEWGVQTYAVLARLRKPVGEGTVLLLGGADTVGAEAACHLLTDESRIRSLYERMGITTAGAVPDFEVLLRAKLLRGFVRDYEIVAHRILSK